MSIYISNIKKPGSVEFIDTQYTINNQLFIPANNLVLLPNNKGMIIPINQNGFDIFNWLDTNGKITPNEEIGDEKILRTSFNVIPTLNNRNLIIDLNIGGTIGVIYEETIILAKGANNVTKVSVSIPYYVLDTFQANGGEIRVRCDGDISIYGIRHYFKGQI